MGVHWQTHGNISHCLSSVQQQRFVHILHNSEQPASCFAVLDNNMCLVADIPFILLMLKLKEYYRYLVLTQNYVCESYVRINKLNVNSMSHGATSKVLLYLRWKTFFQQQKECKIWIQRSEVRDGRFCYKNRISCIRSKYKFQRNTCGSQQPAFFASFKIRLFSTIFEAKITTVLPDFATKCKKKKVYIEWR